MSADGVSLPLVARRAREVADVSRHPVRAVFCRVALASTLAALVGAFDVFALLWFVLPIPEGALDLTANLVAMAVYLPLSCAAGSLWGKRTVQPTIDWLESGRPPTEADRRRVLREPLRCVFIDGTLWFVAAVVFFAVNAPRSLEYAWYIAATILMAGITVTAVAYLLTERLMRPVTALALADGPPLRPVGPGVKGRLLLAWASATGIPLIGLAWVATDVITKRTVTNAEEVAVIMLALSAVAFTVGLLATLLVAKSLAEPLTAMRRALGRVEAGDLGAELRVDDGSEVGLLQSGFNRMASGLRERERLRDVFSRHVGEDVAAHALERAGALGGETRDAAVLFVDVIGSTSMAATRPPQEVVALLNRFFAVVVEVCGRHGGWVNKFEGDAALVVFGCPSEHDDCAGAALAAAHELPAKLALTVPGLRAGIGVSSGQVVAGNVGAEHRYEYTVIGDPVNEAARLSDLAKRRPERVLASEAVLRSAAARDGRWKLADVVELRGRSRPTRLVVPV